MFEAIDIGLPLESPICFSGFLTFTYGFGHMGQLSDTKSEVIIFVQTQHSHTIGIGQHKVDRDLACFDFGVGKLDLECGSGIDIHSDHAVLAVFAILAVTATCHERQRHQSGQCQAGMPFNQS